MSEFDAFRRQLIDLGDSIPAEALDKVVRVLSLEALRQCVLGSPVGNPDLWASKPPKGYVGGQFRGNWSVSVGELIPIVRPGTVDQSGSSTINSGSGQLGKVTADPFTVVWIHNSLPYAVALEEGHSSQAPAGIVGKASVIVKNLVDDISV